MASIRDASPIRRIADVALSACDAFAQIRGRIDAPFARADAGAAVACSALVVCLADAATGAANTFGIAGAAARAAIQRNDAVAARADAAACRQAAVAVEAVIGRVRAIAIRRAGRAAIAIGARAAFRGVDADAIAAFLRLGVAAGVFAGAAGELTVITADIRFFITLAVAAATNCAAALLVDGIGATLGDPSRIEAVDLGATVATEIPAGVTAVAGSCAAAIDITAGVRHAATSGRISRAGEELATGEAFLVAADLTFDAATDAQSAHAARTAGAGVAFGTLRRTGLTGNADRPI